MRMSLLTYPLRRSRTDDLIQRNLIQPKLERGYLAFDKCTLLSSQGSDAPAAQPLSLARRATSLSYASCSVCQIGAFRLEGRKQMPMTTSHQARSAAPRFGFQPARWGNFSILSLSLCLVKSATVTVFSVSGSTLRQLRG